MLLLLPLTKPHHSFSPHQSQSGKVTLRLATTIHLLILTPHPGLDSVYSVLYVESWWLVHDGSCRKKQKGRERRVHKDEAATSHDFTA